MSIFLGIALGLLVVLIFFGVRIATTRVSKNLDPISTMAVALASYFAKLLFLGLGLYAVAKFTNPETVNRPAFGITALVVAIAWLGRDVRVYLKLKLHLPLPQNHAVASAPGEKRSEKKEGDNA